VYPTTLDSQHIVLFAKFPSYPLHFHKDCEILQRIRHQRPYSAHNTLHQPAEKPKAGLAESAPDVLHFVDPNNDTISSLSLRYGVPTEALRRTNGLFADHLLAARRTILIPGEYYKGGVSLSPRPLEGEEEEIRKGKVRKFMVGCKVAE
jgi:hypothetical protein